MDTKLKNRHKLACILIFFTILIPAAMVVGRYQLYQREAAANVEKEKRSHESSEDFMMPFVQNGYIMYTNENGTEKERTKLRDMLDQDAYWEWLTNYKMLYPYIDYEMENEKGEVIARSSVSTGEQAMEDDMTKYAFSFTIQYDKNGKPSRIDAVVCSTQHDPDVTQEQIHEDIKKYVFDEIIPADMVDEDTKYFINPTGRFVIGGPNGDSGLTGRKIIVDTYGGTGRHGGGAFSGKDCTKVDRSAAYAARYVAKNIVAAGLADKCEIQLSYAIGVAHPTSIHVETFGTGKVSDAKLVEIIRENFDLRPAGIIKMLDLRRPIYKQTSAYGHFGRTDVDLPWEHLDKVDDLKKYLA